MKLTDNIKFVFIITSKDPLEPRFVYDIIYAVNVLHNKGVKDSNISIITDSTKDILNAIWAGFDSIEMHTSAEVYDTLKNIECDNLFVVVCCHGVDYGIDAANVIKPFDFTQALKENIYTKKVIAFFGQCYAGLFNYMDVMSEEKQIIYMGVTGIRSGLSIGMERSVEGTSKKWQANISVLFMFDWILNPVDVDNDSKYSVIDMYKYISFKTNLLTEFIEKAYAERLIDSKLGSVDVMKVKMGEKGEIIDMELKSKNPIDLNNHIIPHQDCWILNAIPAINLTFEI